MNTNTSVPNNVQQFKKVYKELVNELVIIRNQANLSQVSMADWLNIDRRKIMQFESLKKINLELLLLYGDKLSTDINLNFKVY